MTIPSKRHIELVVAKDDAGMRLDRYLAATCPDISREGWKRVVHIGGVHLDGRRWSQCSTIVQPGSRIEVYTDGRPLAPWMLEDDRILYRDRWVLAVDKPKGIDSQPTPARFQGTVYQGVLDYLGRRDRRHGRKPEIGMVQRLDRDTSGVMIFSIHPAAHKGLTRQFSEHRIRKFYLALVSGVPKCRTGTIVSNLARVRSGNLVRSVAKGGREAVTRYKVLAEKDDLSLILVEPVTGRSHQIRAHLAEAGSPLLGDIVYGGTRKLCRQETSGHWLHAWQLHLQHPVSEASLHIVADLPGEWARVFSDAGIVFRSDWSPGDLISSELASESKEGC